MRILARSGRSASRKVERKTAFAEHARLEPRQGRRRLGLVVERFDDGEQRFEQALVGIALRQQPHQGANQRQPGKRHGARQEASGA